LPKQILQSKKREKSKEKPEKVKMISRSRERNSTQEGLKIVQSQISKVSPNVTIREQDLLKNLQKAKKQFAQQHSHSTSREHRERSKSQASLVKIHNNITANRDLNQTQPIATKKDEYKSYRKFTEQPSPKKATAHLKTTKSALKTYEKPQSATAKHAISRSNSA
jgi:hypothetical protein